MTGKKSKQIGEWLNKRGYYIDLEETFWAENNLYQLKIRALITLLDDYSKSQLKPQEGERSTQFCHDSEFTPIENKHEGYNLKENQHSQRDNQ